MHFILTLDGAAATTASFGFETAAGMLEMPAWGFKVARAEEMVNDIIPNDGK